MPSPGQNPGASNHDIGGWGPGVGFRRDPPQLHKGSRTFGVAAGGCPASPPWLRGRCEGQITPVVAGVEGWVALLARLPCGWQG
jgi:hypothetical protein